MKFIATVLAFLLLVGCGYSEEDLRDKYDDGYEDGRNDEKWESDSLIQEAYSSGYEKGKNDAESDLWSEGYMAGLYDGYQERKKDEEAGAPDYYESYDEWYYFWFGIYPEDSHYAGGLNSNLN